MSLQRQPHRNREGKAGKEGFLIHPIRGGLKEKIRASQSVPSRRGTARTSTIEATAVEGSNGSQEEVAAAAVAGGRAPARRRPAAAAPPGAREEVHQRLCDLSLAELRTLGMVYLMDAVYYGKAVEICGQVQGLKMVGSDITLELKVSGTTDDGLLRALTAKEGRSMDIHVCDASCTQVLTGEALAHGQRFKKVTREEKDWFTNMEAVVPRAEGPDELESLREAARMEAEKAERGRASPEAKRKDGKDKKKKEKDAKKEEEDKKRRKKEGSDNSQEEAEDRGRKDLGPIYGGTGLDPDAKKRASFLRRARKLGKKKKKKKRSESTSKSSSSSSSSQTMSGEAGLFSTSKKVKKIWLRYPGALTAGSLREARGRLLTSSGNMWTEDKFTVHRHISSHGAGDPHHMYDPGHVDAGEDCRRS